MDAAAELERVRGVGLAGEPPSGFELDQVQYPGDAEVIDHAREVMVALLVGRELPDWFVERCLDDAEVKTCEVRRWSLRAWRHWLEAESRRWWWWSARPLPDGRVEVECLVRAKPWLRGALDWLFQVSREAVAAGD